MPVIQSSFELQAGVPLRDTDEVSIKAVRNALFFKWARMEVVTLDDQVKWRLLPNPAGADFSGWGTQDAHWEAVGSGSVDLSNYYTKAETYNKAEVDARFAGVEVSQQYPNFAAILAEAGAINKFYFDLETKVGYRWNATNGYFAITSPGQDLTPYLKIIDADAKYQLKGNYVTHVHGRPGPAIVAQPGDYLAYMVTRQGTASIPATNVEDALGQVDTNSRDRDNTLSNQIGILLTSIGSLPSLLTVAKNTLVAAINELWGRINDLESTRPAFTPISQNQYGTHPAFTNQHDLNVWLLQNRGTNTTPGNRILLEGGDDFMLLETA